LESLIFKGVGMSWRFVYNKIKEILENPEFKRQNRISNPSGPTSAINVALWHLLIEYPYVNPDGAKTQWGNEKWLKEMMERYWG